MRRYSKLEHVPTKNFKRIGKFFYPVRVRRMRHPEIDYSHPETIAHVIFCVASSQPVFADEGLAMVAVRAIMAVRAQTRCRIYAYCILPDHIHLLVSPSGQGESISDIVGMVKIEINRAFNKLGFEKIQWQRSFYDHVLREDERDSFAFEGMVSYILENPVKAGLVERASDYRFSGVIDQP
ncbi:MAG: transposase [Armatimonadetes bacterium]|nr:transposase [Armatimonadota bacterium]